MKKLNKSMIALSIAFISISGVYASSDSSCTTPVSSDPCCDSQAIAIAMKAIDANDVTLVYKMVSKKGKQEAKDAFELVMKVRAANPELKTHSEQYFAKTVARLHARYDFPLVKILAILFFITTVVFGGLFLGTDENKELRNYYSNNSI